MTLERIPAADWQQHTGHVARYQLAKTLLRRGDTVLDVACGTGYGAAVLQLDPDRYLGVDQPGIPDPQFQHLGQFEAADLDNPPDHGGWPSRFGLFDIVLCFETLEHLEHPWRLARHIALTTFRAALVSVPVVPTKHANPHHLHDLEPRDLEDLFPTMHLARYVPQPSELSGIALLTPKGRRNTQVYPADLAAFDEAAKAIT